MCYFAAKLKNQTNNNEKIFDDARCSPLLRNDNNSIHRM